MEYNEVKLKYYKSEIIINTSELITLGIALSIVVIFVMENVNYNNKTLMIFNGVLASIAIFIRLLTVVYKTECYREYLKEKFKKQQNNSGVLTDTYIITSGNVPPVFVNQSTQTDEVYENIGV